MTQSQEMLSFNPPTQAIAQFDPEPQFSMHSPFRKGESKKDSSKNIVMKSDADSAVRGIKHYLN